MPVPLIIVGIAVLAGAGGTAYGVDQHKKRIREQKKFRESRRKTARKVQVLEHRLGEKNRQVQVLSTELKNANTAKVTVRRRRKNTA